MSESLQNQWALILGASSGFGEATSLELSRAGMHIFGVHLDRKATLSNADRIQNEIRSLGKKSSFFNLNAANPEKREAVLDKIQEILQQQNSGGSIRVFLHSLAFGTLGRYFPEDTQKPIGREQFNMTLEVMAHTLVYWTQSLVQRDLLREGARVFAMTSAGGRLVWPTYGPVSAAKAALESHIRQIALELARMGVTANAIQAGVTDTPALRKIPGNEEMIASAVRSNPGKRLTTPQDVARTIVALSHPFTQWMTGNVIRVDGGEEITG